MKVMELLQIWKQGGSPYVRIIDGNVKPDPNNPRHGVGVIFGDYVSTIPMFWEEWERFADCEVITFRVTHEVTHKQYKERGLIPPYRPDLTAEYGFKDINQKTYYDIVIDGRTARGGGA